MIKIIIPFYSEFDTVKPALRQLRDLDFPHDVLPVQGPVIATNRNCGVTLSQAIRQPLQIKYSHFLFVDSDICFLHGDFLKALSHDKDILALPYLTHAQNDEYQTGMFKDSQGEIKARFKTSMRGLHEIDWCGAGFLLVKASVFPRLKFPYFRYGVHERNAVANIVTEDIGFCLNAAEAGIPIHCDFDTPVYHRPRKHEDYNVHY